MIFAKGDQKRGIDTSQTLLNILIGEQLLTFERIA